MLSAVPLVARSQPNAVRLGLLTNTLPQPAIVVGPFDAGLRRLGRTAGLALAIEARAHEGNFAVAQAMAANWRVSR